MGEKRRPGGSLLPINTLTNRSRELLQHLANPGIPQKKRFFPVPAAVVPLLLLPAKTYNVLEQLDDQFDGIRYGASNDPAKKLMDLRLLPVREPLDPGGLVQAIDNDLPETNNILRESILDLWIDRFEKTDSETPVSLTKLPTSQTHLQTANSKLPASGTKLPSEVKLPLKTKLPSSDDDPFSDDDDEFLKSVTQALKQEPPQPQPAKLPAKQVVTKEHLSPLKVPLTQPKQKLSQLKPPVTQSDYDIKSLEDNLVSFDPEANTAECAFEREQFARFLITSLIPQTIPKSGKRQLIMGVTDHHGKATRIVVRGEYLELAFKLGDIVHVIFTHPTNRHLVDDSINLLIWHPDTLVLATAVASQLVCPRKLVFMSRFNIPGEPLVVIIIGYVVHEIFQHCLAEGKFEQRQMPTLVDDLIRPYQNQLWIIDEDIDAIKNTIFDEHLPNIKKFFEQYFNGRGSPISYKSGTPVRQLRLKIHECLRVEEEIWLPMFGLRGLIDGSLSASVQTKDTTDNLILPLEIKTGRGYVTHAAQATLYSLLFKDRHQLDVPAFLLSYTKLDEIALWLVLPSELKSLINLRNRVSPYLLSGGDPGLPPLLQLSECDRCEIKAHCMTMYEMCEAGIPTELGINGEEYAELTGHLDMEDGEFFEYWNDLITKEENVVRGLMKYLWTMTAAQRLQRNGEAIGDLSVLLQQGNQVELTRSAMDTIIDVGERVIVLLESRGAHVCLARANVTAMTPESISLRLRTPHDFAKTDKFRLDRDNFASGMNHVRFNLLNLFLADGDRKRRELIVQKRPPIFNKAPCFKPRLGSLNPDQIQALNHCLRAEDYALILGMPGTGKTTMIAHLITELVSQGKLVLLTLYTHLAVDTILLKLEVPYMRVASLKQAVHPLVRPFIPLDEFRDKEGMIAAYLAPVVALTCLALNDITFLMRSHFDYCIVDEASQVSFPVCLGPLRFADKFILVGDHNQLPPLVVSGELETRKGLLVLLFQYLADAFPESVAELRLQYRMNGAIMSLSNHMIYGHNLRCGTKEVEQRKLEFDDGWRNQEMPLWLKWTIDPNHAVVFLDHDKLGSRTTEKTVGDRHVENFGEAELVRQTVVQLMASGVASSDIGIMALNRGQIQLLERVVGPCGADIEIMTVDRYQGRDKEVVILLFARLNADKRSGELVKEYRRINVAITRAKCKFIMMGLRSTLESAATMKKMFELLDKRGFVYEIEEDVELDLSSSPRTKRAKTDLKLVSAHPIIRDVINSI